MCDSTCLPVTVQGTLILFASASFLFARFTAAASTSFPRQPAVFVAFASPA